MHVLRRSEIRQGHTDLSLDFFGCLPSTREAVTHNEGGVFPSQRCLTSGSSANVPHTSQEHVMSSASLGDAKLTTRTNYPYLLATGLLGVTSLRFAGASPSEGDSGDGCARGQRLNSCFFHSYKCAFRVKMGRNEWTMGEPR